MSAAGQERRNHGYGRGIFRRRVRLIAEPGQVRVGLEDTSHAMRLVLRHDGARVTDVESLMTRLPMSTCPGASAPLRAFVGAAIGPYPTRPSALVDPHANCTHLHHMTLLALAHAQRSGTRQYDVEIPDEHPDAVWSVVQRDGIVVHRWQTFDSRIVAPEAFAGRALVAGLARWAAESFAGDELEAAFVFSNAYIVSFSRRYDTEAWAGERAGGHARMLGKCYSYQPGTVRNAIYLGGSTRDTTSPETPLLADFD